MDQFIKLKNLLSSKLLSINNNLKYIEEAKSKINAIELLIKEIIEKNFESIDFTSVPLILNGKYEHEQIQNILNSLVFAKEFAIYADDAIISQESQMIKNKEELEQMVTSFSNYLQSLKAEIGNQQIYEQERIEYEKLLKLILTNSFDKKILLNSEDYEIFCKIILSIEELDNSEILYLISELSVLFIDNEEKIQIQSNKVEDGPTEYQQEETISIEEQLANEKNKKIIADMISKITSAINDIEKFITNFSKYLGMYTKMSNKEKNLFSSICQLIEEKCNEEVLQSYLLTFNEEITLNDIKVISKLLNLLKIKTELEEYIKLIEIIDDDLLQEEFNFILKKIADIDVVKKNIENQASESNEIEKIDQESDFSEDFELSDSKNLLIFLQSDKGSYLDQDVDEINKNKNSSLKHIVAGLNKFYTRSLIDIKQSADSPKTIKPTDNIADYSEELKPYRIRHSDVRIAYVQIPLTKNNKEMLKKIYNIKEDFNIILVIGIALKNAKLKIYDDINRRIAKEIAKIRKIRDIFAHDLDENTLKIAIKMISDSFNNFVETKDSVKTRGGKNNE